MRTDQHTKTCCEFSAGEALTSGDYADLCKGMMTDMGMMVKGLAEAKPTTATAFFVSLAIA